MKRRPIFMAMSLLLFANAFGFEYSGVVKDSLGKAVSGAKIEVLDSSGKVVYSGVSSKDGTFHVKTNLRIFALKALKKGYKPSVEIISSKKPIEITIAPKKAKIEYTYKRNYEAPTLNKGVLSQKLTADFIKSLPLSAYQSVNNVVLYTSPGVVQDSSGQIHVRGDHANIQYRINGSYLPIDLAGFSSVVPTRAIESINFLTGVVPPEYGLHTAGILNITTKQGFEKGGSAGVIFGTDATAGGHFDYEDTLGKFSYFLGAQYLQNHDGLQAPTKHPIHDRSQTQDYFGYFSYLLNPENRLSLVIGSVYAEYQIPNQDNANALCSYASPSGSCYSVLWNGNTYTPSNYLPQSVNDNQHEDYNFIIGALDGNYGANTKYHFDIFGTYSKIHYIPDAIGDLIYTGQATDSKYQDSSGGMQFDISHKIANHTIATGLFFQDERSIGDFLTYAFPADSNLNQTSLNPISFAYSNAKTGYTFSYYIQDNWQILKKLNFIYGLRFDYIDQFVKTDQLSPRASFVYHYSPTTTFHISYGRFFTPAPMLLVTKTNASVLQGTTADTIAASGLSSSQIGYFVLPQRSSYYDIGASHKFEDGTSMMIDAYFQEIQDVLDDGQFGNARVLTPFNYKHGKEYGINFNLAKMKSSYGAYLNLAYSVARAEDAIDQQYNFTSDQLQYLQSNYIYMDHDQTYTASFGGYYKPLKHTKVYIDNIYGSGLASGDYPPNTTHRPSYFQTNAGITQDVYVKGFGLTRLNLYVVNVFNNIYELRDQGIGVFGPQYAQRRTFYVSVDKVF